MSRSSRLEVLEDRRLLATVDVIGNVLTFNNDGIEQNNLTISLDSTGNLVLQEQGNAIHGGIGVNDLSNDPLTVVIPANDFAAVDTLEINTHSGDDVLSIDNSNGLIPATITFDGDDGFDSLTLYGSTAANTTYSPGPSIDAGVVVQESDGISQRVDFFGLEPLQVLAPVGGNNILNLASAPLGVGFPQALNGQNSINYIEGPNSNDPVDPVFGGAITGLLTVDGFESLEFANFEVLNIDAGAGSDEINLNNPVQPDELGEINVDGGDPTAGSDVVVVNGTAGSDTISIAMLTEDGAQVTGAQPAVVNVDNAERLIVNGGGGNDDLAVTASALDEVFFTPGVAEDAGSISVQSDTFGPFQTRIPIEYLDLGAGGDLAFNSDSGIRDLDLIVRGTDLDDDFSVVASGEVQIRRAGVAFFTTLPILTPGVAELFLAGLDGEDNFNVVGNHPFTQGVSIAGGNPDSGSDVLHFEASGAAINVNLGSKSITETGFGAVSYVGIETSIIDASTGNVTVNGTEGNDFTALRPTAADAATLVNNDASPTFAFTHIGALTLNQQGGDDILQVNYSAGPDTIVANVPAGTVTDGVNLLVNFTNPNTESLRIDAAEGNDTVTVISDPNIPVFVDGGDPIGQLPGAGDVLNIAPGGVAFAFQAGPEPDSGNFTVVGNEPVSFDQMEQLQIDGVNFILPDRYELNDEIATATLLGSEPSVTLTDLSLHVTNNNPIATNEDFYKITAHDTGKLIFNAFFSAGDDLGDVDFEIQDIGGNVIAASTEPVAGQDQAIIPVVGQQMYFLRVFSADNLPNQYSLEIENFAAATPTDVTLDPNDDSGMMNNDLITQVDDARVLVKADLADFAAMGITILDAAQANAGDVAGAAVEVYVNGQSVGFADPFLGLSTLFEFTLDVTADADPNVGQWAQNIPITTGTSVAVDNAGYFNIVQAAVRIFDGQDVNATGRTQLSQELDVHFDPNTPDAGLATIDMLDASDSGADILDNVTGKMSPAFQGVAEENTKIRLYADLNQDGNPELVGQTVTGSDSSDVGTIAGATDEDGLGLWEITVEPLQDGVYDITIEIEDVAGNSSDQADGPMIEGLVVDTLAPQRPTVDLVGRDVQDPLANVDDLPVINLVAPIFSDTGLSTMDNVTRGVDPQNPGGQGTTDVQLRISAEPGSDVVVKDGEQVIVTFVMPNEPFVFLYLDDILDEDPHPISVEAFDPAGNRSAQSEELLLTVDVTPPAAPSVPDLNASSDTGMFNDDNVTATQEAHFVGTAEANSHIRIYATPTSGALPAGLLGVPQLVGEGVVRSDESDGDGTDGLGVWEVTIEPLEDAIYEITAEVEDQAGNVSQISEALTIEIDTYKPNTPYLDLIAASDSGRHDEDNVTNVDTPTFTMSTQDDPNDPAHLIAANYKFRLYVRPEAAAVGVTGEEILLYDSFADFADFTPLEILERTVQQLPEGYHNFKLEVEDRAGNISDDYLLDVVIDTTAYQGDIDLHPDSDTGVWGFGGTMMDYITSDKVPSFFGVAEANNVVTLLVDDVPAGTTVAVPLDGNDAFQPPNVPYDNVEANWESGTVLNLADGQHTVVAVFEDLAGNRANSEALDFFVDTVGPRVTNVQINSVLSEYDLFDPKPSTDGPTPPVFSLVISVSDLPERTLDFLYDPIFAALATEPGHYQLIGDDNGFIPIASIDYLTDVDVGEPAEGTITLNFNEPLPDDRFTLRISDSLSDIAGNQLDGESNAAEPQEVPSFASGDGVHGGDFIARFTIDSRPEVATWAQGVVYADINGNFVWDPDGEDNDSTNQDFVFHFGELTDAYFVGNFNQAGAGDASGFDKVGAYGKVAGVYQFFLDTDDDGVGDTVGTMDYQVTGLPVAGDFNAAHDGDEIGLYDGEFWYLDFDGDNNIEFGEQLATSMLGLPIVGDFNGDNQDDLAVYNNDTGIFEFDLDLDGNADDFLEFGFSGFGERPVAGDYNLDGVDDLILYVPHQEGVLPKHSAEFHFLISDRDQGLPSQIFDDFSPSPLGNDLISQFGDDIALPLFGNFDPPTNRGGSAPSVGTLTNEANPLDTNMDGIVSARDALVVINALGRGDLDGGQNPLRLVASLNGYHLDSSGDGEITALDALRVINGLADADGEAESLAAPNQQVRWTEAADAAAANVDDDDDDLMRLLAQDQELLRSSI